MITRRNFVSRVSKGLGASLIVPALQSCVQPHRYEPRLSGPNHALGHRLRTMDFGPVAEVLTSDIVIVGGGVSALSAARYLKKFTDNFYLLELGEDVGGNASAGHNSTSSFPWGAHYLPIPGANDAELIDFLRESDVIKGFDAGLPIFNELHLCFDPKERLFINNFWQDGVIPHEGVPKKDRDEISRFLGLMNEYKNKKGNDGRDAFAIPLDLSSQDPEFTKLDNTPFADFLEKLGFSSPYLMWYLNYCCADDYGSSVHDTSAWAGIHYFASRKGVAKNAPSDAVLTWPEGNHWLVKKLRTGVKEQIRTNSLAYSVETNDKKVTVKFFDAISNTSKAIEAKAVVIATPQFIAQRILNGGRQLNMEKFQYAPWVVANITTDAPLNEKRGEPLSWDNVFYGSTSLGYVNAAHQNVNVYESSRVLTFYQPLTGGDTLAQRRQAFERKANDWSVDIVSEMKKAHPAIEDHIRDMEVWVWGHGMIKPTPGLIWGNDRKAAMAPFDNKIFFAHSDLSGISIFEEAFYRGHHVAKELMQVI